MKIYKIALIIGSLRKDSYNRKLADAILKIAPLDFVFKESQISDLPLYNQDDDDNQADSVKRLKAEVKSADALLFVTPEYNRSVPGVLKNALDNASRPYGQNAWAHKPAGIIGISIGSMGTCMAQQHLRNILAYLDIICMCQPEAYFHVKDDLLDLAGQKFLKKYLDSYIKYIKSFC